MHIPKIISYFSLLQFRRGKKGKYKSIEIIPILLAGHKNKDFIQDLFLRK